MFSNSNTKTFSSDDSNEVSDNATKLPNVKPSNHISLKNLSAYVSQANMPTSHPKSLVLSDKPVFENNSPTKSITHTLAACTINDPEDDDVKLIYR